MMTIKEYNEIFYRVGVYHDSTPIWTQQTLTTRNQKGD